MKKLKDIFAQAIKPKPGALALAACDKNIFRFKWLLARGADPNDKHRAIPALSLAVCNKNIKMVRALLDRGADPSLADATSWTPLYWAILSDNIDAVRLLLDAGTNISTVSASGKTPLDKAKEMGKTEIVEALESFIGEKQAKTAAAIISAAVLKKDLQIGKPLQLKKKNP